jgi:uncharacterized membrane protein YoaK (UPF0700 family)
LLSGVAGAVDGIGYVLLHVFTAHVTGNTVHVGTDAGRLDLASAWRPAFAIAAFVVGVALGALTREACARHNVAARPAVLAVSALLLAIFVVVGTSSERASFLALAAPAAVAMGCQNAVMARSSGRRAKTYITGTMTEFAEALVAAATGSGGDRARSLRRALDRFALWFTYLAGGVMSGAAGTRWGAAAALLPLAGDAIAIAVELGRRRPDEALGSRAVA